MPDLKSVFIYISCLPLTKAQNWVRCFKSYISLKTNDLLYIFIDWLTLKLTGCKFSDWKVFKFACFEFEWRKLPSWRSGRLLRETFYQQHHHCRGHRCHHHQYHHHHHHHQHFHHIFTIANGFPYSQNKAKQCCNLQAAEEQSVSFPVSSFWPCLDLTCLAITCPPIACHSLP